jgi:ribosomal-protein-serine acetyltransferase
MSAFPLDRNHPPRRIVFRDTERGFVLRPWCIEDVPVLVSAVEASLPELRQYMPWAHFPLTLEVEFDVVRNFIADYWAGRQYVFGLFDAQGTLLGGLGLHPRTALNPKALEVGYWCHSAHARKGWTTLAVRALTALSFDWFGCDRLQVMHDETNLASRRVVEKCGFRYEGTLTNAVASVSVEARAAGYRGCPEHRLYALVPEQLSGLEWLSDMRERLIFEDAFGSERRHDSK